MLKSRAFRPRKRHQFTRNIFLGGIIKCFYMNTAAVFGNCGYYTPFRAILQGFPVAAYVAVSFLPHLRLVTHD